jgi:hypothetical protein
VVVSGDINGNISCRIKDKRLTPFYLHCDSQDLNNVTILFAQAVKVKVFEFGIKCNSKTASYTFQEVLMNHGQIETKLGTILHCGHAAYYTSTTNSV